ncbi:hypothetical protein A2899_01815 [Candidatus Amesbacteria bacterium RIFCSPLOWO2_01_FULL_49_25]|nr:MAG: hypothetical protein A2899_01815 [Candidatus Amesbacteria bacterium RIFCSPLOWO2_01_FULL_49_25]
MPKLIFTGGHHTSSLEVALQLKSQGVDVVWFGHRHSHWGDKSNTAEYHDITSSGLKFRDLRAGKFYRTYHPLKLIRIPLGFLQSFFLLLRERPDGIVSFGGYLAVPVVITGWLLAIPSITHEQTVAASWSNRLISFFVKKIALTWPQSTKYYPEGKTAVVGLPLRKEILEIRKRPQLSKRNHTVYVTGGKQGSHIINETIFSALSQLQKKYTVIHQTGRSSLFPDYQKALSISSRRYIPFAYDNSKGLAALEKASVVVSRAGAHITYELAVLGKKSVLVPISWASHNEQLLNAQVLHSAGLAVILPQSELSPASLQTAIDQALQLSGQPLALPLDATQKLTALIHEAFKLK